MAVQDVERLQQAWQHLAQHANRLPDAERQALRQALRRFNHDVGDRVGMIRTAEAILRREMERQATPYDKEILDIVRTAAADLVELLGVLQAFVQAIEE